MTRIKICGFREVEHAVEAAQAGADYLGLVLATSKRQITPEKAGEIVAAVKKVKPEQQIVGVFADALPDTVNRVAAECGLDRVQLSGGESWQYCRQIEKPFIKVLHVSPDTTAQQIMSDIESGHGSALRQDFMCLLDTSARGAYGGTGQTFDWRLAGEVARQYPVIIAGGLNPDNVVRLITEVNPWGVDVSSGVETAEVKSIEKITAFINNVKSAKPKEN